MLQRIESLMEDNGIVITSIRMELCCDFLWKSSRDQAALIGFPSSWIHDSTGVYDIYIIYIYVYDVHSEGHIVCKHSIPHWVAYSNTCPCSIFSFNQHVNISQCICTLTSTCTYLKVTCKLWFLFTTTDCCAGWDMYICIYGCFRK